MISKSLDTLLVRRKTRKFGESTITMIYPEVEDWWESLAASP